MAEGVLQFGTRTSRRVLDRHGAGPWNREAVTIAVLTLLLTVVGLVMSFSASFVDSAQSTGDPFGVFRRQLVWAIVGLPVFLGAATLDHRRWRPLSWIMLGASLIGLLLVLTGAGITQFGSRRWLALGPIIIQPSELAKMATLLWLADVLQRKRPKDGRPFTVEHLLIPAIPLLILLAVLVLRQPDLGTTVLLAGIVGLILFVEGLPMRWVATGLGVAAGSVALLAWAAPYRVARISGWLDPEADALGNGYQLLQSLYAMGSGGWFGLGLGSSRGKWNFIPNPETDFIFAIIAEELGLVGALVVLGRFAALLVVGLRIARQARDGFGQTVAFAITGWLVGQALMNVGTVTGLLPITGVTLPLVSVGGSSLVTTLLALGILTSIARSASSDVAGGSKT